MEIFRDTAEKKIVLDINKLKTLTQTLKDTLGYKVVITIGTWDMLHIGHLRYLIEAKKQGDVLLVGADTDRAVKLYKGPLRPVIPQSERMEMLSYQHCIDLITLVDDIDEKGEWKYQLIKEIQPDIFVAEEESYPQKQLDDIRQFCKEVVVLERQAKSTSTSMKIQDTLKKHIESFLTNLKV
ncbi:MAG: adenylyltransferase/cytidyltransferase family protein [Candidatus Pacebacteria bacterium]|nr:adenylyltransferase/cytidyltransferase family protein [Candidatus Paceibacterota bacterium]